MALDSKTESRVALAALKVVSEQFDIFIGECMDENGKPKAPDHRSLAQARGILPPYCEHAYSGTKNQKGRGGR